LQDLDVQVMKLQDRVYRRIFSCLLAIYSQNWCFHSWPVEGGGDQGRIFLVSECGRWMLTVPHNKGLDAAQVQDVKHVDPALVAYFRAVRFCAIEHSFLV
jgi:hypothetical protein